MLKIWRYSIIFLLLQGLSGCTLSFFIPDPEPQWRIPIVSKTECRSFASLEGEYVDKGRLFRQFNDLSINYPAEKFSTAVLYPRKIAPSGLKSEDYYDRVRKFNASAITQIKKSEMGLEVTLYGGDGLPYEGSIISLSHPNAGCDADGNLVLREYSRTGGAEFTPVEITVTEVVFYKTENGMLKVRRSSREWLRTIRSTPVREEEVTLEFPLVHRERPANSDGSIK